jgi:hypothetical protein
MADKKESSNLPWWVLVVFGNYWRIGALARVNHEWFFLSRVEKYRPNNLDELISHKDIIKTSKNLELNISKTPWLLFQHQNFKLHGYRSVSLFCKHAKMTPNRFQLISSKSSVVKWLKCIWHEISYFLKWKNSLSCSVTYFSVSYFYGLFPRYFNLFDM